MKKSLKMLALGLAVIPCALVMTACGDKDDGKKDLDTTGKYSVVAVENYSTVISELNEKGLDIKTIADGCKAVINLDANSEDLGFSLSLNTENYLKNYSKIETTEGSQVEAASHNTIALTMGGQSERYTASAYIKENNLYADMSSLAQYIAMINPEMPTKFQMPLDLTSEVEPDDANIPTIAYDQIFENVPEEYYGTMFILEKAQSGNDYKIKVTLKGEALYEIIDPFFEEINNKISTEFGRELNLSLQEANDITIYIVYNESNFIGVSVEGGLKVQFPFAQVDDPTSPNPSITTTQVSVNLNLKVEVTTYTGDINFPTFDESYLPFNPNGNDEE